MLKIKEAIIVEGRYDKNTLSQLVDTLIIETRGFGIFKDREKQQFLRALARRRGVIVFTDSDGAGFVIRHFLSGCLEPSLVKHAYIPDISGKEKRKSSPSKEGKLGVEGMTPEILEQALRRAGATVEGEGHASAATDELTKADLYAMGLSGRADSARRRQMLQRQLGFPENMTANGLLQALNVFTTREELQAMLREENDRS